MKKRKGIIIDIIIRILVSPFMLIMSFIFFLIKWLEWFYYFALYGGETIIYNKQTRINIERIYKKLEKDEEEQKTT